MKLEDLVEEFMPIPGFEGFYLINKSGNVFSIPRLKIDGRRIKARFLKPSKSSSGYLGVTLYKHGKLKRLHIHRLVAIAFIPNNENFPCINHKNGIKEDNKIENLEWCNHAYNAKDAYLRGRIPWNKGRCGRQKNHNTSGLIVGGWNKGKKLGFIPKMAFKKGNIPWNKKLK